jgi:hypothetical protein
MTFSIMTFSVTFSVTILSIMGLFATLSIIDTQHHSITVYVSTVMLNVIILTVVILNVTMLSVIMLNVVAPF